MLEELNHEPYAGHWGHAAGSAGISAGAPLKWCRPMEGLRLSEMFIVSLTDLAEMSCMCRLKKGWLQLRRKWHCVSMATGLDVQMAFAIQHSLSMQDKAGKLFVPMRSCDLPCMSVFVAMIGLGGCVVRPRRVVLLVSLSRIRIIQDGDNPHRHCARSGARHGVMMVSWAGSPGCW